jgi:hypothetical protein
MAAGAQTKVTLKLSKKAKKLLKKKKKLSVRFELSTHGIVGAPVPSSQTATLKAPKGKKKKH